MIDIVKNNLQRIQEVCKKHHVQSLYLFGSAVNATLYKPTSDIDFLYKIDIENFNGWIDGEYDYTDNLMSLEKALTNLLNSKIDLVPDITIQNKYFKKSVETTKQVIYEA